MSSKNDIQSWALFYLEQSPTVDIESTSAGQSVAAIYDSVYSQMLKKNTYGWSFARKIKTLGQVVNPVKLNDYEFAYQLPTDYLLTIKNLTSTRTFMVVGDLIYSNEESFTIMYISRVDESLVSDEFAHAVAYDIASRLAGSVTGKVEIKQDLIMRASTELRKAISLDIAQMDTQQYMPRSNAMYDSKFRSGFNMAGYSNLQSGNNGN